MMPAISSEPKARSVLLRMLPAEPSRSNAATPASSSGKSAMQTRSYSPTVHSSSRTLPPELWTSLVNSSARCVVSRKFLMPCSVQLNKDTYVVMLAPPRLRECAPCCSLQQASQADARPCPDPADAIQEQPAGQGFGWPFNRHITVEAVRLVHSLGVPG